MENLLSQFENSKDFAGKLDGQDPLGGFRAKFFVPIKPNGEEVLYFTGNSLGLQPRSTRQFIEQELKDWEDLGVEGHFHAKNPWMPYHEFLTNAMANVVGGKPVETVVMNSLTVNLHLLMVSFYRPTAERYKIIIESDAFPSDKYAVKSQIDFWERRLEERRLPACNESEGRKPALIELTPRQGETTLRTEDIENTIAEHGDSIALIMLGGVNYYTGQAFDMKRITEAGHKSEQLSVLISLTPPET
ncbi:MAG: hypothetical protein R2681_14355 [Pyrinomonadaceae bacterium]